MQQSSKPFFRHFGEELAVTHANVTRLITGIFNEATASSSGGRNETINIEPHALFDALETSDLSTNDTVSRAGQIFYITEIMSDGAIAMVFLSQDKA